MNGWTIALVGFAFGAGYAYRSLWVYIDAALLHAVYINPEG